MIRVWGAWKWVKGDRKKEVSGGEKKRWTKGKQRANRFKACALKVGRIKWQLGRMSSPKVYEPIEVQKESESESKVNIVLNLKKDE